MGWHELGPGGPDVVLRRAPERGAFFEPPFPLSSSGAGTHVSLATMDVGLSEPKQHLAVVERFHAALADAGV